MKALALIIATAITLAIVGTGCTTADPNRPHPRPFQFDPRLDIKTMAPRPAHTNQM